MFVVFDYRCPSCGHQEERFVRRSEMDAQTCKARVTDPFLFGGQVSCNTPMVRLPAGTRTHFRFSDTRLKR